MLAFFSIPFTAIVVLAIGVALVASAPSIPRPKGKGNGIPIPLTKHSRSLNSSNKRVDIDGLKSRAASYTTKLLRGLENYDRNMGTTHPYALRRSGSQDWKRDGAGFDLTAGPDDDVWYGTIFIGTPPKPFTVQVDTGSSDLFIPASTGDAICKSHDNLFNPALSETAQDLDKTFELNFADGANTEGRQYTDVITIAGFTADKQIIGAATTYSAELDKHLFHSDGMLGLAFPSISRYPATPLLQTLLNEGKLLDGIFSLELAPDGGEMYIGGVNNELYIGDITFVDVQTKGFWEVIVDDIRINGRPVLTDVVSIIDTGANHIFGDLDRVSRLHRAYGGKAFEGGWYTFPCNDFPDVTFTFSGEPFTILADNLNLGLVEDNSPDCFSGIVARDKDILFWSIGSNFLKLFYTVFNMGSDPPQVGFAQYYDTSSEVSSEVSSEG